MISQHLYESQRKVKKTLPFETIFLLTSRYKEQKIKDNKNSIAQLKVPIVGKNTHLEQCLWLYQLFNNVQFVFNCDIKKTVKKQQLLCIWLNF